MAELNRYIIAVGITVRSIRMKYRIMTESLPNIPWQDKKDHSRGPLWRYDDNPIIKADHLSDSNSIFNSAVVPFQKGFAGVFRCDNTSRHMRIHTGFSIDGINWDITPAPIKLLQEDNMLNSSDYQYDPRVVWIEDRWWITWCNGYHGPTIGVAWTKDFVNFYQYENSFLPFNRNGVLFPRKINGYYAMLSRPSDTGHTAFGDIFYSESPDMVYWGRHRHVMSPSSFKESGWQSTKIGAGPVPIETSEGWLLFYHGVLTSCNGFVYSFGAALLDIDEPWRIIARSCPYLLAPQNLYEVVGDVPNVVFPCASLADKDTGRIAIYYGCADTVTSLTFGYIDNIIDFLLENSL